MLEELDRWRASGAGWWQWDDDDFEPVARAIDNLFLKQGSLKQ